MRILTFRWSLDYALPPYIRMIIGVGVLSMTLSLPFLFSSLYQQDVLNQMLVFAVLASGYNIALGYTGLFSLGHIGLFAIGAYTSALLTTKISISFALAFLASGVAAGVAGLVLALLAVRVKSHYLALLTLAFASVVQLVITNQQSLTGGSGGITNIKMPSLGHWQISTKRELYYFLLAVLILAVAGVRSLDRSRFGRALKAVRDSEIGANVSGVGIRNIKIIAFVLSSLYTGWAGSLYAHSLLYISPEFFSIGLLITLLAMVLIGGSGTVYGPVIGAVLVVILPELLRFAKNYYLIVFGLTIWATIVFLPEGIAGSLRQILPRRKHS